MKKNENERSLVFEGKEVEELSANLKASNHVTLVITTNIDEKSHMVNQNTVVRACCKTCLVGAIIEAMGKDPIIKVAVIEAGLKSLADSGLIEMLPIDQIGGDTVEDLKRHLSKSEKKSGPFSGGKGGMA